MRRKKALYNIISNLLLEIVIILYGFIVPKIIISKFGSDANGLISSITQLLGYITLLESGFGPVVLATLYKPIADNNKNEIEKILAASEKFFRNIAKIFIVYIILLAVLYPIVVKTGFSFVYTFLLIIIISTSTFTEYYFGMTYKLYIQAEQKNYIISAIQIFTYILNISIIVLLAFMNQSLHIIKLVSGIAFIIRPLLQNLYVKKKYEINIKHADKNYKIEKKWDGLAQHIAFVIHTNTDITVLTLLTNLAEVSVYSVYCLVVRGVRKVVISFAGGLESTFGSMIAKNETKNLKKKFNTYEVMFGIINTIVFSSTIVLIVPFVSVYTKNVTDANYVRVLFGPLLVISEYIWTIRQPYNLLIKASGHFKETRIGAWIECISNIVISVILVNWFGLIGVALGTIVAMTIRTIEFVYHANKYILNRSIMESTKKIFLIIIETILIVFISKYLPLLKYSNYINWIINAIIISLSATIITLILNYLLYKNEFKKTIILFKNIFKKK